MMNPVRSDPRNVMITGGCGFIGSNFINHIGDKWPQSTIVNFDGLMQGSAEDNIDSNLRSSSKYILVKGDLRNQELVLETLRRFNIDTVVNFAANSHVDECYNAPISNMNNNILGMTNLLEACKCYGLLNLFVHISSDEVYGDSRCDPSEQPKSETTALKPTNQYSASKAASEAVLHAYQVSYHLPAIILRMNNVYGPRQWDSKVVPRFIREAFNDEPLTIMGDGKQLRSWMYVDDCCEGIRLIADRGRLDQTYNLGVHFELSIIDLAKRIHDEVGRQLASRQLNLINREFKTVAVPDRPYNDRRYFINTEKLEHEIGWKAKTPFKDGLRKTVEWFLNNPVQSVREQVLVYGGRGWIGQQLTSLLKEYKINFTLAQSRPGTCTDENVEREIVQIHPTHVVCLIGRTHGPGVNNIEYLEGGPIKTRENLRDNLYAPCLLASICDKHRVHMTYVGTGCLFEYDNEHTIGGKAYTEEDQPNFFHNSYGVVKGYTDVAMRHYSTVFNARIRLPINHELDNRNLLMKLINYQKIVDFPNSITFLPSILPVIVDLMRKKFTGTLNLTNPGPIRHSETLSLYRELVDPSKEYEFVDENHPEAERPRNSRSQCALDTSKLVDLYPNIPTAQEAARQAVLQIGAKLAAKQEENELGKKRINNNKK